MTRNSNWEMLLADYLRSNQATPFAWGSHDCCTFTAGAVEAITGEDKMPEFRGSYNTALGAARALGDKTLEDILDTKFDEIPIGFAQRGDIALMGDAIGVVDGGFAYFVGEEGLEKINRKEWDKAWGVGRG
jgi:hypothetical protein